MVELRVLGLLPLLIRQGVSRTLAYRASALFVVIFGTMFAMAEIVSVLVYFRFTDNVAGWDLYSFLMLIATVGVIQNIYQFLFVVSHEQLMEKILYGDLDYDLVRPVNSLLLVNAQQLDLPSLCNLVAPAVLFWYCWPNMNSYPSGISVLAYGVLTAIGLVFYCLMNQLLVGCSFWIERPLGLTGVPEYLLELAKRPLPVYPRSLQVVFGGVLPVLLATNLPVDLLRGQFDALALAVLFLAILVLGGLVRWQWQAGLRRYSSAN